MSFKVLVVDDSPFIRRVISDWVSSDPQFEVVGSANNGKEAVARVHELNPDIITMDVEMPVMDGLQALEQIMSEKPTRVLMVSSITSQGATATLKALELGAIDFVTKPQSSNSIKFIGAREEFFEKLRAAVKAQIPSKSARKVIASPPMTSKSDKVVVIASSTGGPRALAALWQSLPKGFPCPILVAQHMPEGFTLSLAKRLDGIGTVPCKEAEHGEVIQPGHAYICPGGKHMTVDSKGVLSLNEEAPLHGVRPAADHLFVSAARAFGSRTLGLVLTGMGRDGADGAVALKAVRGTVFGESSESCTVYGMPRAAMAAGGIDAEYPIQEIGTALTATLKEKYRHAS